jgi:hypothetical protein
MTCLQYSIQTMMPSLLGTPTGDQMFTCGLYGIQNGHDDYYLCNAVTGECAEATSSSGWLWNLAGGQTGSNTVWADHTFTDDEKASQNLLGLGFLPWNTQVYKRTDVHGATIPMNPWNRHTIMENSLTIVKIGGISLVTFYIGKFAVRKLVQRR